MNANKATHVPDAETIKLSPAEVDAGAEAALTVRITYPGPIDLRQRVIRIKGQDGAILAHARVTHYDGLTNESEPFLLNAPHLTGTFTLMVAILGMASDGTFVEESAAPVPIVVKPHDVGVVVWDVPPAIEAGQKFRMKIGVKCSSNCGSVAWLVEVRDHSDRLVETLDLPDEPWPSTAGLPWIEVELEAPPAEGLHRWSVTALANETGGAHAKGRASFGVRTVAAPEYRMQISAVDMRTNMPVAGAKVVVHPYRVVTDAEGVAEILVPRGRYRVLVSGKQYIPFGSEGNVESDVSIRAELAPDEGLSDAEIWG